MGSFPRHHNHPPAYYETLTAYVNALRAEPKTPLIITAEWVESNRQEAIRLGIIDQDGNVIGQPFIKD